MTCHNNKFTYENTTEKLSEIFYKTNVLWQIKSYTHVS